MFMGRPKKDLTLRRNGSSFQVWVYGELQRSVSVRELADLLNVGDSFRTGGVSAQELSKENGIEKEGFHTESERGGE